MSTQLPPDIVRLTDKLAQLSPEEQQHFLPLLVSFNQAILAPSIEILNKLQTLQQKKLPVAEQKNQLSQIQQRNTEIIAFIHHFVGLTPTSHHENDYSANNDIVPDKDLNGVRVLLVDDDATRRGVFLRQLQHLEMDCAITTVDTAFQTIQQAEHKHQPYQIVMISAEHLDHHTAYLARTIKANPLLNYLMLTLVLQTRLPDFEKERAHFGGFSCVLCPDEPIRFLSTLANAWRSWSAKLNFIQAESPVAHNRILLVEDDPIPQKITQRQLSELGLDVDVASDGHTALKLLEQHAYNLVFMDIGLPDISGLEVTAEFRKREHGKRHTPIIGLTIYALESDEETGLQAGMDDYLVKPLLQDKLEGVLNTWIKTET